MEQEIDFNKNHDRCLQPDAGSLFWMGQPVSLNYPWKHDRLV